VLYATQACAMQTQPLHTTEASSASESIASSQLHTKPRAQGSSAISPNEYPTTPHRRRPLPAIPPKLHTYTEEAHHTSPLQHEALPYHRQLTQAFRLYHHLVGVPPPYRYEAYSAITTPQRKHLAAAAFRAYRAHWLFGRRHSDEGIAFSFVRGTC